MIHVLMLININSYQDSAGCQAMVRLHNPCNQDDLSLWGFKTSLSQSGRQNFRFVIDDLPQVTA
jgi:hypothetical protein